MCWWVNKELFEWHVHIYSLTLPEDPEYGIQFNADALIFLHNNGSTVWKNLTDSLTAKAYKETVHNIVDNITSWNFNSSTPPTAKIFKK